MSDVRVDATADGAEDDGVIEGDIAKTWALEVEVDAAGFGGEFERW